MKGHVSDCKSPFTNVRQCADLEAACRTYNNILIVLTAEPYRCTMDREKRDLDVWTCGRVGVCSPKTKPNFLKKTGNTTIMLLSEISIYQCSQNIHILEIDPARQAFEGSSVEGLTDMWARQCITDKCSSALVLDMTRQP
jgi:hypothetical protein